MNKNDKIGPAAPPAIASHPLRGADPHFGNQRVRMSDRIVYVMSLGIVIGQPILPANVSIIM